MQCEIPVFVLLVGRRSIKNLNDKEASELRLFMCKGTSSVKWSKNVTRFFKFLHNAHYPTPSTKHISGKWEPSREANYMLPRDEISYLGDRQVI